MKILFNTMFILLISNGVFTQVKQDSCIENTKFKTFFYKNIKIVEDRNNYSRKVISKALQNLNYYVIITGFEKCEFAGITYGNETVFNEYKKTWIEWYEQNKCRNIKRRKSIFYRSLNAYDQKTYKIH
jgi:hypothetical protein